MLDETTCPVCGKDVWEAAWLEDFEGNEKVRRMQVQGIWAVAHYLAHLVELKQHAADEWPANESSPATVDKTTPVAR